MAGMSLCLSTPHICARALACVCVCARVQPNYLEESRGEAPPEGVLLGLDVSTTEGLRRDVEQHHQQLFPGCSERLRYEHVAWLG